MLKPIMYPAISSSGTSYYNYSDEKFKESKFFKKNPRFYNTVENSYIHNPYILFSAAHHYKLHDYMRDSLSIDNQCKIFIDSGGWQLLTKVISEKDWNNKTALEWSEKNGNIFPILDRPIANELSINDSFKEKLRLSVDSAKYYYENRSNTKTEILNVLSARTIPQLQYWYDGISKYKFDGWAHGCGAKKNIKIIIKTILFMFYNKYFDESKITPYHIFGITTNPFIIYITKIQSIFNKLSIPVQFSYDSTSFQSNMRFGTYFCNTNFNGISNLTLSNRFDYSKLEQDSVMPLPGEIFDGISAKEILSPENKFELLILGLIHNLKIQLDYKSFVEKLLFFNCKDAVNSCFSTKIKNNLEVIDKSFRATNLKAAYYLIDSNFDDKDLEGSESNTLNAFLKF